MHSTNVRQIKAALRDQAFLGTTQVTCPKGRVVAVSRWNLIPLESMLLRHKAS